MQQYYSERVHLTELDLNSSNLLITTFYCTLMVQYSLLIFSWFHYTDGCLEKIVSQECDGLTKITAGSQKHMINSY